MSPIPHTEPAQWLFYWAVVSALVHLLGLVSSLHAVWKCRTSEGAIAWGLSLLFCPYLALPAYWTFGKNKFTGYVRDFQATSLDRDNLKRLVEVNSHGAEPFDADLRQAQVGYEKLAQFRLTTGNQVDLLVDGKESFETIFAAIRKARHYVLVEFFIIKADRIGREFQQVLLEKAREGVKISLVYDDYGCWMVPKAYFQEMREAGIEVVAFAPGGWLNGRLQINFRNHRKIVVVDGEVAMVGGMNISDDTLGRNPFYGKWRDTQVSVRGPAVLGIQLSFLNDYHWASGGKIPAGVDWTPHLCTEGLDSAVYVPAGPADRSDTGTAIFLHSIQSARRRLWLATPYFLPTAPVRAALRMAVLRGVEVRIIIPNKRDLFLPYLASFSYLPEALAAGIQIHLYRDGYTHQKTMLIDEEISWVGSSNLDARSMELNFEGNLVVFGRRFAETVERMLKCDMERSRPLTELDFQRGLLFQMGVRFSRLFVNVL